MPAARHWAHTGRRDASRIWKHQAKPVRHPLLPLLVLLVLVLVPVLVPVLVAVLVAVLVLRILS